MAASIAPFGSSLMMRLLKVRFSASKELGLGVVKYKEPLGLN